MKVLLIEDDLDLAKIVSMGLQTERFSVDIASDGLMGLKMAASFGYDAIVTDVMVPTRTGDQICQQLRNAKLHIPIIALSAVSDLETKLRLFSSGVDDYITKPFEFKELIARIKSNLRKRKNELSEILQYSDIVLDLKKHEVTVKGTVVNLREKEIKLLEYFLLNPEQVLTREMILSYVWGPSIERYTNVVDVHVHHLRQKIENHTSQKLIKTINHIGYKIAK